MWRKKLILTVKAVERIAGSRNPAKIIREHFYFTRQQIGEQKLG